MIREFAGVVRARRTETGGLLSDVV